MDNRVPPCERIYMFCVIYRRTIATLMCPILLSPLIIFNNTVDYKCVYINTVLLCTFLIDGIPLPVTALMPLVLYPIFGVLPSNKVADCYMKDTTMAMLGSMFCMVAIVNSKVHQRVAILFLGLFPPSHRWLTLACACITTFLSMWIPNPMTVSVMLPIIEEILNTLQEEGITTIYKGERRLSPVGRISGYQSESTTGVSKMYGNLYRVSRLAIMSTASFVLPEFQDNSDDRLVFDNQSSVPSTVLNSSPEITGIGLSYYLMVAYSATIGGIGTLIGTTNNMAFKSIYECLFPEAPIVQFPNFMIHCTPIIIVIQGLMFLYFQVFYMGMFRPNSPAAKQCALKSHDRYVLKSLIRNQYTSLGPFTYHQKVVLVLFVVGIIFFVTQNNALAFAWPIFFNSADNYIGYSANSFFIVLLYFIIPLDPKHGDFFDFGRHEFPKKCSKGILTILDIHYSTPWGLVLVLGTGYTVCSANRASGADKLMVLFFTRAQSIPGYLLVLLVMISSKILAEIGTGVGVISISLPTFAYLAVATETNPYLLMMAAYLAGTFVFHLPSSSPSNGIVANFAQIPTKTMVLAGIGPSIIIILVGYFSFFFWTPLLYSDIWEYPEWARI